MTLGGSAVPTPRIAGTASEGSDRSESGSSGRRAEQPAQGSISGRMREQSGKATVYCSLLDAEPVVSGAAVCHRHDSDELMVRAGGHGELEGAGADHLTQLDQRGREVRGVGGDRPELAGDHVQPIERGRAFGQPVVGLRAGDRQDDDH